MRSHGKRTQQTDLNLKQALLFNGLLCCHHHTLIDVCCLNMSEFFHQDPHVIPWENWKVVKMIWKRSRNAKESENPDSPFDWIFLGPMCLPSSRFHGNLFICFCVILLRTVVTTPSLAEVKSILLTVPKSTVLVRKYIKNEYVKWQGSNPCFP